jgi:hypothetical protein
VVVLPWAAVGDHYVQAGTGEAWKKADTLVLVTDRAELDGLMGRAVPRVRRSGGGEPVTVGEWVRSWKTLEYETYEYKAGTSTMIDEDDLRVLTGRRVSMPPPPGDVVGYLNVCVWESPTQVAKALGLKGKEHEITELSVVECARVWKWM